MTLIIDTSVLVWLEKGKMDIIDSLETMRKSHPAPPCITFITYFEFLFGLNERKPSNKSESMSFLEAFRFLSPTKTTATILSELKYKYEKKGKPIPLADLMIASQAMENNMTLLTTDKYFNEIEELNKIIL